MVDLINISLALFSIVLGLFGWLAPKYTMQVVDLQRGATTMGVSEIRAASGALFVGLGVGALFLGSPVAYAMIGFAWGFASIGRLTSIIADEAPTRKTWGFFLCEAAVGITLVGINVF
ncbi:DUF4345 family protein [Cognatishimia sp. MH4019]|uniref:DUF4345 family protein n=1 Tax=Cognatishimia sp. MH4019 TaxID=2854030 RepID=UPI001CD2621F|nr:DUF4345 family protein [Cognatishimia sp. MH4019]